MAIRLISNCRLAWFLQFYCEFCPKRRKPEDRWRLRQKIFAIAVAVSFSSVSRLCGFGCRLGWGKAAENAVCARLTDTPEHEIHVENVGEIIPHSLSKLKLKILKCLKRLRPCLTLLLTRLSRLLVVNQAQPRHSVPHSLCLSGVPHKRTAKWGEGCWYYGRGAGIRHKAKSQHVPLQGETRRGEPGPVPGLRENSVVDKQLTYDFAAVYAVYTQCL